MSTHPIAGAFDRQSLSSFTKALLKALKARQQLPTHEQLRHDIAGALGFDSPETMLTGNPRGKSGHKAPAGHQALSDILKEFVADVEAAHGPGGFSLLDGSDAWPDLHGTYLKARNAVGHRAATEPSNALGDLHPNVTAAINQAIADAAACLGIPSAGWTAQDDFEGLDRSAWRLLHERDRGVLEIMDDTTCWAWQYANPKGPEHDQSGSIEFNPQTAGTAATRIFVEAAEIMESFDSSGDVDRSYLDCDTEDAQVWLVARWPSESMHEILAEFDNREDAELRAIEIAKEIHGTVITPDDTN